LELRLLLMYCMIF